MSSVARATVLLIVALSEASCGGRTQRNRPDGTEGGSDGGAGLRGDGGARGGSLPTAGSNAIGGIPGDAGTASGTGGVAGAATGATDTGGATSGGSSGAAADVLRGCKGFALAFLDERCDACRTAADPLCEAGFGVVRAECGPAFLCVDRNCIFGCRGDQCEPDTCACLDSCLPRGSNACRIAFEDMMSCYADACEASCSATN